MSRRRNLRESRRICLIQLVLKKYFTLIVFLDCKLRRPGAYLSVHFYFSGVRSIQTSNFLCAKLNANQQKPLLELICTEFRTSKVQRLNWSLEYLFVVEHWIAVEGLIGISNYVHVYSEKELLEHNYNEERGRSKNIESKLEIGKYLQWNGPIEIYDNKLCSLKCLSCLLIWLQPLLSIIRAMRETWGWLVSRTKQCRSQQRENLHDLLTITFNYLSYCWLTAHSRSCI